MQCLNLMIIVANVVLGFKQMIRSVLNVALPFLLLLRRQLELRPLRSKWTGASSGDR